MKTKLLTILLFLFPVMLFAQNYEKEGDMYFEEGKYLEAEKKYKAAATLSGESSALNQKQEKSSTCYTLLTKAKEAEEKEMYSTAVDSYNELYSIHNLPQYKEKANALKQKVEQLQKEKEKNNINELYQKGLEYYKQNNLSWAYDEFEAAAEKGHVNSMYYCGKCLEKYKYTYYRDALEWYQHAADHGHVDAQYKLGEFYYKGKGVDIDKSLGLEWYTKAAENNQKDAILFLVEGFHNNNISGNEAKWYKKAAEIGIYLGEYHLAIYYEQGTGGVANDVNKALKWYNRAKKSSEQLYWDNNNKWPNNIVQEVWMKSKEKVEELKSLLDKQKKKEIAMKKADDYFNKKQFSSAIESYKEALVLDNDKDILYKLGCCYEQMSQHKSAVVTYLEAANQNHKDAAYQLGLCYEHGKGVDINHDKAITWYLKAEKQGHKEAQIAAKKLKEKVLLIKNIADYKSKGESCFNSSNYNESVKWYEKAAALGDVESMYWLAEGYRSMGQMSQAIDWYRKAAENNNSQAMLCLGKYYEKGIGVPMDYATAKTWYISAADQGNAEAQYQLGYNYENEIGGTKDLAAAFEWYSKAANNGYSKAYYKLGYCYSKGIGCNKNTTEAAKWYEKAAENGNVKAQNKIGNYYNYGIGVDKNTTTAYKWYKQAADNGHSTAKVRITQDDYFTLWDNWEVTWLGINGSLGTGYELGVSVLRVRYLWFQLNLLDFKLSDRFSNIKEFGYSEPYLFYQPTLNVLFPVYDSGAVYLGMGPSWEIYMQEFDPQLKVEAGFRFNYGYSASSDVFLRYDGYTFSVGASIQWSSFFY